MSALDRSTVLRRLGITEWLPRAGADAERVPDGIAASELGEFASSAPPQTSAQPSTVAQTAVFGRENQSTPAPVPTIAVGAELRAANADSQSPQQEAPPSSAASSEIGLRGRLLRANAGAAVLVLAMAEKSPRDTLLNPETESGTLLRAMLAEVGAETAVAMLGVGGGEALSVPPTILVLGERSARLLLGNDISPPLRGRVHLFGQSRVVVTYHPDELRQNGSLKRLAWDDLRLLGALLAAPANGPN